MPMPTRIPAATPAPQPPYLAALRFDVIHGLSGRPKTLPSKWLYDTSGSKLFEQITRLPEYYPTRTERALLGKAGPALASVTGARSLIELGSGSADKASLLLTALAATVTTYVPVDVSASALEDATRSLTAAFPQVVIAPQLADFAAPLEVEVAGPRLVAFLGGTFGNLLPDERGRFLTSLASRLLPGDYLLLGVDLVKDPAVIVRAYDDAAGVTAAFNRGILHRINRELGGDFDADAFEHVAVWDEANEWIEMRLRSLRAQTVTLAEPGLAIHFDAGEDLRTEVSAKFRPETLAGEVEAAGMQLRALWTNPDHLFGLALISPDLPVPSRP
ncbi:L-histidine N(alpha)-methyltransferase [Streptomyces sp. NPDC005799]|uniref:L-histidine N(alpha)-methyltransferase n=1 Tax=Streptomyces sp. NPDC005799 TaxID=3154678 RepID=UPI0033C229D5